MTSAPGNKPLLAILNGHKLPSGNLNDTSFLKHADRRLAHPFFVGFSNSMDLIFLLAAAVMLVGFLVLLGVEELPLRTMSGIQAQHADAKAERDRQQAASGDAPPAADGAPPSAADHRPRLAAPLAVRPSRVRRVSCEPRISARDPGRSGSTAAAGGWVGGCLREHVVADEDAGQHAAEGAHRCGDEHGPVKAVRQRAG